MNRNAKIFLFLLVIGAVAVFAYVKLHRSFGGSVSNAQIDSLKAAYTVFENCPPEGDAVSEKAIELNKFKSRFLAPQPEDFADGISLSKILEPGNDRDRWSASKAARIQGYIYDVKPGGVETCNCKEREEQDRDTHIEMVADPMQTGKTYRMIVEVTPRMRDIMSRKGEDWSTRTLRDRYLGRWVEVEGWLLFDDEHEMNAENTNPGRPRNWRATAWEIHPITSIKVIDRPRSPSL
jgi:hypothetical protein